MTEQQAPGGDGFVELFGVGTNLETGNGSYGNLTKIESALACGDNLRELAPHPPPNNRTPTDYLSIDRFTPFVSAADVTLTGKAAIAYRQALVPDAPGCPTTPPATSSPPANNNIILSKG